MGPGAYAGLAQVSLLTGLGRLVLRQGRSIGESSKITMSYDNS